MFIGESLEAAVSRWLFYLFPPHALPPYPNEFYFLSASSFFLLSAFTFYTSGPSSCILPYQKYFFTFYSTTCPPLVRLIKVNFTLLSIRPALRFSCCSRIQVTFFISIRPALLPEVPFISSDEKDECDILIFLFKNCFFAFVFVFTLLFAIHISLNIMRIGDFILYKYLISL